MVKFFYIHKKLCKFYGHNEFLCLYFRVTKGRLALK